jgi:hypothetical protein
MLAGAALVELQNLRFVSLNSCFPEDYAQEMKNFRQGGVFSKNCDNTKINIW